MNETLIGLAILFPWGLIGFFIIGICIGIYKRLNKKTKKVDNNEV